MTGTSIGLEETTIVAPPSYEPRDRLRIGSILQQHCQNVTHFFRRFP